MSDSSHAGDGANTEPSASGPVSPSGKVASSHRRVRRLWSRGRDALQVDVEGAEFLPEGAAILAANDLWAGDVTRLFGSLDRPVSLAVTRVPRLARHRVLIDSHDEEIRDASAVLADGELVMIQPEGGRSPDGNLHRGAPDVAWLALTSRVPVLPVDIVPPPLTGPVGDAVSALLGPTLRIGEPLDFSRYWTTPAASDVLDGVLLRGCTDEIMAAIAELSGQLYQDDTPGQARERLAEERRAHRRAQARAFPTQDEERRREAELRERMRVQDERDLEHARQEARAHAARNAVRESKARRD